MRLRTNFNSNELFRGIVDTLAEIGAELVEKAEKTKTFTHDTFNLHDSYGYGVYFNHKLVRIGFLEQLALEKKKWKSTSMSGRTRIIAYLHRLKPKSRCCLVIATAMPYDKYVEAKGYKVISQIYGSLAEAKRAKLKGLGNITVN